MMPQINRPISEQLDEWISSQEGENFEFKEAKTNFHFETLAKYCCALANEGGGKVILGVTDKRPRQVVGTKVRLVGRTKASRWYPSSPRPGEYNEQTKEGDK